MNFRRIALYGSGAIVGLTQSSLDQGNLVQVLQNGDQFFPPLLADIAAARESIHIESYIWWKGTSW